MNSLIYQIFIGSSIGLAVGIVICIMMFFFLNWVSPSYEDFCRMAGFEPNDVNGEVKKK